MSNGTPTLTPRQQVIIGELNSRPTLCEFKDADAAHHWQICGLSVTTRLPHEDAQALINAGLTEADNA